MFISREGAEFPRATAATELALPVNAGGLC